MINFKQEELIHSLFNAVRKKFPEVEFLNVTESPENPADLWVNITEPEDEDREIGLIEFACDKTVDILLDYGYHISVMPRTAEEAELIKQSPQTQPLRMTSSLSQNAGMMTNSG